MPLSDLAALAGLAAPFLFFLGTGVLGLVLHAICPPPSGNLEEAVLAACSAA